MRVCLVIPPAATEFGDPCEARAPAVQKRVKQAPLGILAIAAVVRARGHSVSVLDLNTTYYDYFDNGGPDEEFCDFTAERLKEMSADVVGFGTICSSYPFTLRVVEAVRRRCPSAILVAGGPQATVVDEATLQSFPSVDLIVRGEGDQTFPMVLDYLEAGQTPARVPGISFRDGRTIRRNPNAPPVQNLDALPLPAYDLFANLSVKPSLALEAGRGCPFACTFCSTNDFFRRRFRLKSPQVLIAQMTELEKLYGARAFDLVHDMFTVDRRRVAEICDAFIANGRRFIWSCSARTDCVDEALLDLMARAGCRGIFYGIESGSARMQKIIDKNLDLDRAHCIIDKSDALGIPATVSVIAGFPEEELTDLEKTVDFIYRASRHDSVSPQIHLMAPLAETPVHRRYCDQLVHDDIYSDLSHQGWYQHPADRVLIASHPNIFPNFYGFPARISRPYVRHLCRFIYYSLAFCRWLAIAMQTWFGPLSFFDQWLEWRRRVTGNTESGPRYYASIFFRQEFPAFVQQVYGLDTTEARSVCILADYELKKLNAWRRMKREKKAPEAPGPLTISGSTVLHRSSEIAIFDVRGDVTAIVASLRNRTSPPEPDGLLHTMSMRISDDQLRASAESASAGSLLRLFENPCSVGEAISHFCEEAREIDGFESRTVFGYTLKRLLERELLQVAP